MTVRLVLAIALCHATATAGDPPIVITSTEHRPYPGVANIQVHRAEPGWTYNHHVDMACWKGRLYLAWDSCEKDEDVWPSREMYATSADGLAWSEPKELFPQGLSTQLRMFFFHAPNGRMLAIAGLRMSREPLNERMKGPVIVREIGSDHALGPVHLLRAPREPKPDAPPPYEQSHNAGFVEACNQLLANKPFLEQSDYGLLLGDRRMKWHDVGTWPADEPSRGEFARFGKGASFYHRKDGTLVAVMKWGWVLVSHDEGETWSAPTRPPTFVSGMAKAWGQRTPDGRFALAYNPHLADRFPLVIVTGDDGIAFGDMRTVHDEVPPIRHHGLYKVPGPQYVRGVSEWSSDGSRADERAIWLAYSVGKEDIWVSRVPTPIEWDAWSTYSPKLAPVIVNGDEVTLEDRDPTDYSRAFRVIDGRPRVEVTFEIVVDGGTPVINLGGSQTKLRSGKYRVIVDRGATTYSIWHNDKPLVERVALPAPADYVSFRTGDRDTPVEPARFTVKAFKLAPLLPLPGTPGRG